MAVLFLPFVNGVLPLFDTHTKKHFSARRESPKDFHILAVCLRGGSVYLVFLSNSDIKDY